MAKFVVGATVEVTQTFKADDESKTELRKGYKGIIDEVDADGDLAIDFVDVSNPQQNWVYQENQDKLKVVGGAEEDTPAKKGGVAGLHALLETCQLLQYEAKAEAWCEKAGARTREDVESRWEQLADALGLKNMERKRLQKQCGKASPKASPKSAPKDSPKSAPKDSPKATPKQSPQSAPNASSSKLPAAPPQVVVEPWPVSTYAGKPVNGRKRPLPSAAASPDLLWECMRHTSSFLRKPNRKMGDRREFNAEPCNLMGLHTSKFSGLSSMEGLDVRPVKSGVKESIQLVQSHTEAWKQNRPSASFVTTGVAKESKKGLQALDREIDARFYRKSLLPLAKEKYIKVKKSFKKKSRNVKSRRATQK